MSPNSDSPDRQRERQNAPLPVSNRTRAAFAVGLFVLTAFVIIASFTFEHYSAQPTIVGALVTGIIGLLVTGRL